MIETDCNGGDYIRQMVREGFSQERMFELRTKCTEQSSTCQLEWWVGSQFDSI